MDLTFRKTQLRKKTLDRRAFPRTSVLWSALIATSDGRSAFDCIIRNINAGGAEISSKKALELDEKVHLLVTRTQIAYLASVAWIKGERMVCHLVKVGTWRGVCPRSWAFSGNALPRRS